MKSSHEQIQNFMYNIAYIRRKCGISKKKMAKILGIGVKSLDMIKNGVMTARLTSKIILNVWVFFGVHPKDAFEHRLDE